MCRGEKLDGDSRGVEIHILYAERGKNHIQHRDDEDEDNDDIVEYVGSCLLIWVINVHHPDYHEENAHNHLK
ncbi:hypothetical protein E2C01_076470 [Portunus trituberculatus]|uniref:Uncharacterized protein n=1 Tax=Portunus trituberculatus TaxID=210409 RepID=A0A5B7INL9_PORTR|nr:hypothetical protein [Portunus trituberculatus]